MKVERTVEPTRTGLCDRDGVALAWEVFGDSDGRAVVLLPPWNLQDSRVWRVMIGCLWPGYTVITFDPPGNGRSTPASDPARHTAAALAADTLAVLDSVGVDRAVAVAHSRSSQALLLLAAQHPDRVAGAAFLSPLLPYTRSLFPRTLTHPALRPAFELPAVVRRGWARMNAPYIRAHRADFDEWFMRKALSAPHSEGIIETAIERAADADLESVLAALRAPLIRSRKKLDALAAAVSIPVVVVAGSDDVLTPRGDAEWLAGATGGKLVTISGGDHCPHGRPVVTTAAAIRTLAEQVLPASEPCEDRETRAAAPDAGRPKVLVVCSPIGLGHARRDVAIVQELRRQRPELDITWLAQHPVTAVLDSYGETIHPASAHLLSECRHFELESVGHELDVFGAFRRSDDLMARNFAVFREVMSSERFDLVIGDEAWEVDLFLHDNPGEKRAPYIWITDFVGLLPLEDTDARDREIIADTNALMVEQVRKLGVRDASLFVGNPADAVDLPLGPGLPTVRSFAEECFSFTGYVGTRASDPSDREQARRAIGVRDDEPLCVVAVGGSGIGSALLDRAVAAHGLVRQKLPDLRTVVVTGPRLNMADPGLSGLSVVGYVPDLDRVLAAADMAVVQGGLATAMELTSSRTPFAYVPLQRHFEQNLHVPHRLGNYRSGIRVDYPDAHPDHLADLIATQVETRSEALPVESDGHVRAAQEILRVLDAHR
jgi:pimeloyl-ACP methyl ester carboxylesterase